MSARYATEFTGEHWLVIDRHADGQVVAPFDPGDRGRRAAEADCRRRNAAAPAGVRSIADVEQVVANAGFARFAYAADIHAEWRCGAATVFVRDDLGGAVSVLVRCPAWCGDVRLPAGVPLGLVAATVEAARDARAYGAAS